METVGLYSNETTAQAVSREYGSVMGSYRDDGRENEKCSIRGYILGSSRG